MDRKRRPFKGLSHSELIDLARSNAETIDHLQCLTQSRLKDAEELLREIKIRAKVLG